MSAVVTVGTFDGVHRAHRAVLEGTRAAAERLGIGALLVSFDPHPLEVVRPASAPPLLTTGPERLAALAETGIGAARVLRFDAALAALSPEAFVRDVLVAECRMRALVVGDDHGLGRGRAGDTATLRALGERFGFAVEVVPAVREGGERISSSRIRRAVAAGDLAEAAVLLGRPYAIDARVVPGARRGRLLGVPTINLEGPPARKLLPPDGVYAAWVEWRGGRAGGMLNQGPKPTFADGRRSIEVHLFGVDAELYGETVRVQWATRLRDVRRFESPDQLVTQLAEDRRRALAALGLEAS